MRFLEMFRSDHFADMSLNQWMALVPPGLVRDHLHADQALMDALHKDKRPVVE
jgi:oxalate decarboxylase